jgi:hypothetical protein
VPSPLDAPVTIATRSLNLKVESGSISLLIVELFMTVTRAGATVSRSIDTHSRVVNN